jgi:SAM-dependent methyltransferase
VSATRKRAPSHGISAEARAQWKATYEKERYDRLPWFQSEPSPTLVEAVTAGFFPKKGKVLDVGCGAGSNVLWLAGKGYRAHGVDLAPGALRAARERAEKAHLRIDVQEGDALALPFPKGNFDAVLDHGCFHTLPIARRSDYRDEIARVLGPEGRYLLVWVAREFTGERGPTHRPSVAEVAQVFEPRFLFQRTTFRSSTYDEGLPAYAGWLVRRRVPQPKRR